MNEMNDINDRSTRRGRRWRGQSLVEFALTLPLLLLLLFGIIEFGRIFQAWVTLQNAARTAARYATTGAYETSVFPNLDDPAGWKNSPDGGGIPCPYVPGAAPATNYKGTFDSQAFFRQRWGFNCNGARDEDNWLRKDVLRLVGINRAAQQGAVGLGLGQVPSTNKVYMDIPGTGIGSQVYSDAALDSSNVPANSKSIMYKAENVTGYFHVWICSTRASLFNQKDQNGAGLYTVPRKRYAGDYDYQLNGHQRLARCTVSDGDPAAANAAFPNGVNPAANPNPFGTDQYDAGGPGDFVDITVYFNHPLITPLGLVRDASGNDRGFIQLQARRRAVVESYRSAKVINLSGQGNGDPTSTPFPASDTPTFTPTFTPTNTYTPTSTSTSTFTATSTFTKTPTNTATPSKTLTPSITPTPITNFGTLTRQVWSGVTGYHVSDLTSNAKYPGTPSFCDTITTFEYGRDTTNNPSGASLGTNYGVRVRGYIIPPVTGSYVFSLTSTNDSILYLSSDNSPNNISAIANVTRSNNWPNWTQWSRYSSQTSGPRTLTANQPYYIELLHKRSTSPNDVNDFARVAWIIPGNARTVIAGQYIAPFPIGPCPQATATLTPSLTLTPSRTPSPTITLTPSMTLTPSRTPSPTITFTPSMTLTPSLTPSKTPTRTPTSTFTPSKTFTPTLTPSKTLTPLPTNTFTPGPTSTFTPTKTLTPVATNTPVVLPTLPGGTFCPGGKCN